MQRKTTEDFIGTCQACFGEFKVSEKSKLVVLHGYKRPGYGSIKGSCEGVDHAPFEYDTKLTVKIIADHRDAAERAVAYLSGLRSGSVDKLFRIEMQYGPNHQRLGEKLIEYTPESTRWDYVLRSAISETESRIFHHTRYADFLQAKVDAWARGQIVGIDVPATGRVREYRKAFDPVEEKAMEERAAIKAARAAKPGKLSIIFYQPSEARPGAYKEIGETEWRKWIDRKDAKEKAFAAEIKQWAKANIDGKTLVRPQIGDYDLPRDIRGTGNFDVVIVNLPWEYRDEITHMFSSASLYINEPKKVSYVLAGGPRPH